LAPETFYEDLALGMKQAPMQLRHFAVPARPDRLAGADRRRDPHAVHPLGSQQRPDHPMLRLDSLGEQKDSPVEGLTHRYRDKASFCRSIRARSIAGFARDLTPSAAIPGVEKLRLSAKPGALGKGLRVHRTSRSWRISW